MQQLDGSLVLSPSDLTGFAACEHLTQLDLAVARGERERPEGHDLELEIIARAGTTHETAALDELAAEGRTIVEIVCDESSRAALLLAEADTVAAMLAGAEAIYQATFFDGTWRGHADFLLRVDESSDLGDWSYEVADAKLARRVKAAALLQMSAYSEQVERLQGRAPTRMHVFTGDGERHAFRVADYAAHYRALKARYEALVLGPPVDTYPDPVEHCGVCRWADPCDERRHGDDHLSIVAGMRRDQIRKLTAAGITTTTGLAGAEPGLRILGMGEATSERLRRQAELQVRSAGCEPPLYAVLAPDDLEAGGPERGFAALPAPSPGDLFFDMEGDPFALDGGLEYLFGVVEMVGDTPEYHSFWGHDRAGEKEAFEAFIDFVSHRLARDPGLHIYHYAPYEPSAVRRLMGAHGTREDEVDALLRGRVFVDLYHVLRQSVRVSTESYSLKKIEALYMQRPPGEVMTAASSIVAYEKYLETRDNAVLHDIASYNRDDCESTRLLRDWVEDRRRDAEARFGEIPRPEEREPEPPEALAAREKELAELEAKLCGR